LSVFKSRDSVLKVEFHPKSVFNLQFFKPFIGFATTHTTSLHIARTTFDSH
jgi:hypothetical protein